MQGQALSSRELSLLFAAVALAVLAIVWPPVFQATNHHDFADKRILLGVPFAFDTLSNLPFLVLGSLGLLRLHQAPELPGRLSYVVFFTGLILTAVGSGWYHLKPNDEGLAVDRFAMAVSFAGIISLAAAERVSARAGVATLIALLFLAPCAVGMWAFTGNVMPWAVVQFGGLLGLCWFACLRPQHGVEHPIAWWQVVLIYVLAKAFEHFDHQVFSLTAHGVSGHSLKHLMASLSALPLLAQVKSKRQI